jgi:hypothetical protein
MRFKHPRLDIRHSAGSSSVCVGGLVRDASLGALGLSDLGHAAALLAFAQLMWRLAI